MELRLKKENLFNQLSVNSISESSAEELEGAGNVGNMENPSSPAVREANEKLLQLGRTLIPINFTRRGKFHHDPAVQIPALPDIAPALQLAGLEPGSHRYRVTQNHLLRGQNRVVWAMKEAQKIIRAQ